MIVIRAEQAKKFPGLVSRQINNLVPDDDPVSPADLDTFMEEALLRTDTCVASIRVWRERGFDHLLSMHYSTFMYFLMNTIWRNGGRIDVCDKLFQVNKALNGIEISYEASLPERFLIAHTVGVVLTKAARYGNYLVLHQGCTIGQSGGKGPEIGEGVVLYPHATVVGASLVGAGAILSQGVRVIHRSAPANTVVFTGEKGDLIFKPSRTNTIEQFFVGPV